MKLSANVTSYFATLASVVALALGLAFALNVLVDPLWYFGGNRLGTVNFAFNERISKANRIAGHEHDYDCVIFGDSRVTLLPEQKIAGYRCYNFAFSSGTVPEFVDYAKWLRGRGFTPKLIVVGVSAGDFRKKTSPRDTPDFVRERRSPPSPFIAYLSLDAAAMSLRTLFGRSPLDRLYDLEFRCRVAYTGRRYDPRVPIRDLRSGPFDERRYIAFYKELHEVFPEARYVGYGSPLSAWAIDDYRRIGWLESYTRALHAAATVFDLFIDYSVPSPMTVDPTQTYDGTHYSEKANATIAADLIDGPRGAALNLGSQSEKEMLATYRARLAEFAPALRRGESASAR